MFKLNMKITSLLAAVILTASGFVWSADAATVLTSSTQCSAGNADHGISTGDVTGNAGGSSDCWGAFKGNDPGPSGDGIEIDQTVYDFTAKIDFGAGGNVLSGTDIGLDAVNGGAGPGTWSFDMGALGGNPFLIVLKKANNPGYAVWLFEGTAADSYFGSFSIAWRNTSDASHISIYSSSTLTTMPLPAGGILLVTALGGFGIAARRRRRMAL